MTIFLLACLAIYVAWNLGANDVANSMGTSVGSKAITLTQAIIIAGILEFAGAVIFGREVSATIASKVVNPDLFVTQPQIFVTGMIAVLISCGLWLQIATSQGLPVASSHAVVGAIAGFSWVAMGKNAVDWSSIGKICLGWLSTPILSGIVAIIFYNILWRSLFESKSIIRLQEWIPWLSAGLVAIFGTIVFPKFWQSSLFESLTIPRHDLSLALGGVAAISVTTYGWQQLKILQNKDNLALETVMAKFQVISACFVAFAHGSNDVGNAIAPLAAIVYVYDTNTIPFGNIPIPFWILVIGGLGIVLGLAVQGKNVIATVGENIISLVPSTGFCAEIATATTILLASRIGLPVSTSHTLVGSIVGIGLWKNRDSVDWSTIKSIVLAWIITLPAAAILGAVIFRILNSLNFLN
ncbi:Phosphate transporter [Hyella patelloides LEGE 07179]|uniref:Phosphate transporter n=1 Tax=Hyella patelloides LEGE 07179 TaxID=945734 RepID=A0A563VJ31_9CYAN|nr:inorganic phosphate transporter [Hyella patelloides]VEP11327.1 Phosphate transporter [Hyella patelloides LEGE 07179]